MRVCQLRMLSADQHTLFLRSNSGGAIAEGKGDVYQERDCCACACFSFLCSLFLLSRTDESYHALDVAITLVNVTWFKPGSPDNGRFRINWSVMSKPPAWVKNKADDPGVLLSALKKCKDDTVFLEVKPKDHKSMLLRVTKDELQTGPQSMRRLGG